MDYFLHKSWLMAGMFLTVAISAPAQQTIIYSKPADLPANKTSPFQPGSQHRINSSDYNAPRQLFNDYTPDLPVPQVLFQNNDPAVADALNKRKNWTLLTPEQILGIQTPEQILGVPDRSGEKKLSLEEQYLLRERRSAVMLATNSRPGVAIGNEMPEANPFGTKNKADNLPPFQQSLEKMDPNARYFNPLRNMANSVNTALRPDEKPSAAWNSVFAQPNQPKPTDEQLADMERFRTLMEPSTPPDKTPVTTRFSGTVASAPDPYLQSAPIVNPAGRAIPSLANELSSPGGIKPLPGIATPTPKPATTKPASQAQLPPWMNDGPQSHNPNRNF